jgi:hypothetical protein
MLVNLHGENPSLLEDICLFSINTNYIGYFDKGLEDIECRKKIIEYFSHKNLWRKMEIVFKEVYPADIYTKETMLNDPHFKGHKYEWNASQGYCLDLTESFLITKNGYIDRDFFDYFFAFRLSKIAISRVLQFLSYNLVSQFGGDIITKQNIKNHSDIFSEYFFYLKRVMLAEYSNLIGQERTLIINDYISSGSHGSKPKGKTKETVIKEIPLMDFFSSEYEKQKNADLFRTEIIDKILKTNTKLIPGAKAVLNQVVNYLYYEKKIWRSDLELLSIAHTLKKETGFTKLNHQAYQKDRIQHATPDLESKLQKIAWLKPKKSANG